MHRFLTLLMFDEPTATREPFSWRIGLNRSYFCRLLGVIALCFSYSINPLAIAEERTVSFELRTMEISENKDTRVSGIKLKLAPWILESPSGSVGSADSCEQELNLQYFKVSDHQSLWAEGKAMKLCPEFGRLSIKKLTLDRDRIRIKIGQVTKPSYGSEIRLKDIEASCGKLFPLSVAAEDASFDGHEVSIQNARLSLGPIPLGWFPHLSLEEGGRPGLLLPQLNLSSRHANMALPVYIPASQLDWIIAPSVNIDKQRASPYLTAQLRRHEAYGETINILTRVSTRNAILKATGVETNGGWHLGITGRTQFGRDALRFDPNPSMSALGGVDRLVSVLGWHGESLQLTLTGQRLRVEPSPLKKLTQFEQRVTLAKTLAVGKLQVGNWSALRVEPDIDWLSDTYTTLRLEKAWIALRAKSNSEVHLHVDSGTRWRAGEAMQTVRSMVMEHLTLRSDWARQFDQTTHLVGLKAEGILWSRYGSKGPKISPWAQRDARHQRLLALGASSRTVAQSLGTRLGAKGLLIDESETGPQVRTQFNLGINGRSSALEVEAIPNQFVFIQTKARTLSSINLKATYLTRSSTLVTQDFLAPVLPESTTTFGYHITSDEGSLNMGASLWVPTSHQTTQGLEMFLHHRPRCECINWQASLLYGQLEQDIRLTLTFDLSFDQSSQASMNSRPFVPIPL